jgi:hypothetical protein
MFRWVGMADDICTGLGDREAKIFHEVVRKAERLGERAQHVADDGHVLGAGGERETHV